LLASAGLEDLNDEDEDSNPEPVTPQKRKRSDNSRSGNNPIIKMQMDVLRVPGLSADHQLQISKFDSSEFDVSHDMIIGSLGMIIII
jgi:hypothetical protein